jgi:hypothetical protein
MDDFSRSLNFLLDVGTDLSSIVKEESGRRQYWCDCHALFMCSMTTAILERSYSAAGNDLAIVQNWFLDYYDRYTEQFNSELVQESSSGKFLNDRWIAIVDTRPIHVRLVENRFEKCTLKVKAPGAKNFDNELPLSEMYAAAKLVYKEKKSNPDARHYPYAIIYGVYKCIIAALTISGRPVPQIMVRICNEIEPKVTKSSNPIKTNLKKAEPFLKIFAKRNVDLIKPLVETVDSGIDQISDETIEEVSEQAHKYVSESATDASSLTSLFEQFMPGSADRMKSELDSRGVSFQKIQELISDNGGGVPISNEELSKSIPSLDELMNS